MPPYRSFTGGPSLQAFALSSMLAALLPGCVKSLDGASNAGAGGAASSGAVGGGTTSSAAGGGATSSAAGGDATSSAAGGDATSSAAGGGGASAETGGGSVASSTTSAGGASGATSSTGQGGGGGAAAAAGVEVLWARPYPCSYEDPTDPECAHPRLVDVDTAGNIVFYFKLGLSSTIDYEGGDTIHSGHWAANVLARYDSSGQHLWHVVNGSGGFTSRVSGSSSSLVVGGLQGSDGAPPDRFGFVLRYSAPWTQSAPDWTVALLGGDIDMPDIDKLAADGAGNTFVFGRGSGSNDYVTKLAKLDETGMLLWIRDLGGKNALSADAFTLDGTGGVYVVRTEPDILSRLDANGTPIWQTSLSAATGTMVKADGEGAPSLFVEVVGDADLGGGVLPSVGRQDIAIARLDPEGHYLWSKRFGAPSTTARMLQAFIDPAGDLVVISSWKPADGASGAVDFGGGALPSVGVEDLSIAKFDAAGHHLWSKRFGAPGASLRPTSSVRALLDGSGNLIMGSVWDGGVPVDLDQPLPVTAKLGTSLVKLDAATGATRWATREWVDGWSNTFAVAPDGGVIVATDTRQSPVVAGNLLGGKHGMVLAKLAP